MTLKQRHDWLVSHAEEERKAGRLQKSIMLLECAKDLWDLWQNCKMQVIDDITHPDNEETISDYNAKNSAA